MARGKGRGHKGQHRRFTNPDDLAAEREREAKNRNWRRQRGQFDDEEEEEESESTEQSSSEDESDDDQGDRKKGVEGLIEVENPNRVVKRQPKLDQINVDSVASSSGGDTITSELSRREREEIEKQRAKENYLKLHAQGKTEQARADLARLAIIRQQREDAAKKRDEERKMREQQEKEKQASKTQGIKAKK